MDLVDCHVYNKPDHINAAKEQIKRKPHKFPQIQILKDLDPKSDIETILKYIENLQYKDFKLTNYKHHPKINVKMVA
uniref:Thymidylate synthase n=1 Tax=Mimivirus LCMiAC02 TaxID=2506609 RepID=A0A481Z1K1_9VIRU|nr:MAG: thymidylate synthase [Mimivirus LCMiAC02]